MQSSTEIKLYSRHRLGGYCLCTLFLPILLAIPTNLTDSVYCSSMFVGVLANALWPIVGRP